MRWFSLICLMLVSIVLALAPGVLPLLFQVPTSWKPVLDLLPNLGVVGFGVALTGMITGPTVVLAVLNSLRHSRTLTEIMATNRSTLRPAATSETSTVTPQTPKTPGTAATLPEEHTRFPQSAISIRPAYKLVFLIFFGLTLASMIATVTIRSLFWEEGLPTDDILFLYIMVRNGFRMGFAVLIGMIWAKIL